MTERGELAELSARVQALEMRMSQVDRLFTVQIKALLERVDRLERIAEEQADKP